MMKQNESPAEDVSPLHPTGGINPAPEPEAPVKKAPDHQDAPLAKSVPEEDTETSEEEDDDGGFNPFAEQEKEDDFEQTLKWLNTAMYRWFATNLREYEYDGKEGKAALIAAVDEIYRFADSDLLELKASMNTEINQLYDKADRELSDVKKIVNGVKSASLVANTGAAAAAFSSKIPVIGLAVSTGLSLANIVQQVATMSETQKRMAALNEAVLDLQNLDIKAMKAVDQFNDALLSVLGNTESSSKSVREGAQGFLMAVQLARDVRAGSFEEFMNEMTEQYIAASRNFDTQLDYLKSLEVAGGEMDMKPLVNMWVAQATGLAGAVAGTALGMGTYYASKLPEKAPLVRDDAFQAMKSVRFDPEVAAKVRKSASRLPSISLDTKVKAAQGLGALFSLAAIGLDIASLVSSNKEFNRLTKQFKQGRAEIVSEISEYVDKLEDTQDALGIVPLVDE